MDCTRCKELKEQDVPMIEVEIKQIDGKAIVAKCPACGLHALIRKVPHEGS